METWKNEAFHVAANAIHSLPILQRSPLPLFLDSWPSRKPKFWRAFVTKMKHSWAWHSKDVDRISLTLNNSPTTCACGSQAVCWVDLVSPLGARDVAVATVFLLPKIRPWWSCRRPKMCFLFSASCLTQSCRTVVLLTQLLPTACFIELV